ncbi:NAD-dependent succinate-semialdehyde dehydrogenase [Rhodococcus jostii]|uniref:NAD-dependent succinate-semialdehyde dehydrogenase n=1 Tax=Rhodococcus jostii TaxID=132919 RepID=A0ABU4CML3_RHOJO|nr:NAD-dependent succinate-semialdehyde dehydrogenase [Rhodococcus jostii]MDV6284522.1 NAD-dependent succinate-semialdehyde dehydrogenase [Rhodococcus jostii]
MYATIDPTTGGVVQKFPTLTAAETTDALTSTSRAYREWSRTAPADRAEVLRRMAELHRANIEELAATATLEMGKPITQARAEVELAASIYEYYATVWPSLLEDEVLDISGTGRALVKTEAIGPLLGIMPWNFPFYQVARFVAPNLLLGNTILLKHAPNCPQAALAIEAIATQSGAPTNVYRNLFATHEQVATMIASPLLQGISLTGSERAGRAVGALAGQNLKKCVLELGGSDPLLVLPEADLDRAAPAAANGRFWNAGQVCTSSKRAIITEPVWSEFVSRFLKEAATWSIGDPRADETRLGPLASVAARDEVAAQVADAIDKGAALHLGGEIPSGSGAYYPATVLSGVTPEMRAYHEEIFGPVAVLYRVENTDAAIVLANNSPFGLGSAVFTTDQNEAVDTADRLDVGMVGLNMLIRSSPEMPFGGVKNSGFGRELGRFGLDEFANKKLIRIH